MASGDIAYSQSGLNVVSNGTSGNTLTTTLSNGTAQNVTVVSVHSVPTDSTFHQAGDPTYTVTITED